MPRKSPLSTRTYLYDEEEESHLVSQGISSVIIDSHRSSSSTLLINNPDSSSKFTDHFVCCHCHLPQESFAALMSHITRFHTVERKFKCDICVKSFRMSHHLKNHTRRTHNGSPKFTSPCCLYCKKKFVYRRNLYKHERSVHCSEKHYPCRYCYERFNNRKELTEHIVVHPEHTMVKSSGVLKKLAFISQIKPFVCRYCPLRFSYRKDWNVHISSHLFEKQSFETSPAKYLNRNPSVQRRVHRNNNSQVYRVPKKARIRTETKPLICTSKSNVYNVETKGFEKIHVHINKANKSVNCKFSSTFPQTIENIHITCGYCKELKNEGNELQVIENEVSITPAPMQINSFTTTTHGLYHDGHFEIKNATDTKNFQKTNGKDDYDLILGL